MACSKKLLYFVLIRFESRDCTVTRPARSNMVNSEVIDCRYTAANMFSTLVRLNMARGRNVQQQRISRGKDCAEYQGDNEALARRNFQHTTLARAS